MVPAEGMEDDQGVPPGSALRALSIWAVAIAYVLALPSVGYLLATPALLAAMLWLLEIRSWMLVAVPIGFTIPVFLVFTAFLNVRLPTGILDGACVSSGSSSRWRWSRWSSSWHPLIGGVELFFVPSVLLALVGGMLWGSIAGAMPGFNQTLAVGVMVPFTFAMGPVEAVTFLVAIGVGVSYGNSIPAILVGLPGTPSAVLTALDGHALHKRGESGLALGASYFAAVAGQFVSSFFFILMVVPLSQLAYHFLAPELFALHMLGITAIVSLTGKNVIKGIMAAALGFGLTIIGPDPIGNNPRFTFGIPELRSGLQIVPVALGLLAVSEIIRSTRQAHDWRNLAGSFSGALPGLVEAAPHACRRSPAAP